MALPVAIQVYSVRDEAKADLRGTLEQIKEMGYAGVEFAGLYGYAPAEVKKICEEVGLIPISAHVPYLDMAGAPRAILSQYAEIGCKYVAVPYLTDKYRPGTPAFPEVIENVERIGKAAKELGIQLLYHNHDFEFVKLENGEYGLDYMYSNTPAENLQTELDTCWVNIGGEVPAEYIRKYAGRCPVVHLKDFVGSKSENMYALIGTDAAKMEDSNKFEFRPVGSGKQDFPAILEAAVESGAEYVIVEQDNTYDSPCLEAAKMSRDYLKSLGW